MFELADTISTWFLIFIFYSVVGWCLEMLATVLQKHKIINRGSLIGPVCPIYGFGAVLISLVLGDIDNIIVIFCVAFVGSAVLEYITSYIMEKLFNVRWWDYTTAPFNLNGRICLHAALMFGVLGIVIVRLVNPWLFSLLNQIDVVLRLVIAFELFILLLADLAVSLWLILGLKVTAGTVERDATEEISERVREILMNKGHLNRRLVKAFPKMEIKKAPAKRRPSTRRQSKSSRSAKPKNSV